MAKNNAPFRERLAAARYQVASMPNRSRRVYETGLRFKVYETGRRDEFRKLVTGIAIVERQQEYY